MTNQSNVGGKRKIKAILTTVIAVLLIVSTFATSAFADSFNSYEVNVVVDGEAITVTTNETEPIEILKNAGITIADNDKMNIASFEENVGGTIEVQKIKNINIEYNNNIQAYDVYSATVGDALKEIGITINEKDKSNYNLTDRVKDGMVITIKAAFNVSITADGTTKGYSVIEGTTVKDLLTLAGVTLGADDYTKPSINAILKANSRVEVFRVEYKEENVTEAIKYSTKSENDSSMTVGTTKTIVKGVNGSKAVTYKTMYVNGVEKSKEVLAEKITKKPVNAVVKVGTKSAGVKPNGVQSRGGYSLGQKISGRYTHYCVCARCNGNSRGITASGKRIWNGMANPHYVACNWLPLGSVIKVGSTNYTVVDRGGSGLSRQGRIDIFTPGGHSSALRQGTGNCTITIVRLGW